MRQQGVEAEIETMGISKIANQLISFHFLALFVWVTFVTSVPERAAAENVPADTSLSDVLERETFIVGADIPYGVMEFYDETGKLVGIDIDIGGKQSGVAAGSNECAYRVFRHRPG